MTKEELVKLLVANFKDGYGNLDLSGLDFTNESIKSVDISRMKAKGDLYQNFQEVGRNLFQDQQEVGITLYQCSQKVGKNIDQSFQEVEGHLWQNNQEVGGTLCQD